VSLTAGTRLGPYEVIGLIGAGGMGEVYRARDTKLDRNVAIKVLPEVVAADPDRLARFEREARTLAALNHPNIAHVYDAGRSQIGTRFPGDAATTSPDLAFLAMELVEGEDLSAMIVRGALPLPDALPIARQIADALETAHEQGIIHRDLKPANIKVRHDGTVKVLDFGLAKALATDGATAAADAMSSPTLTARATQMGMILGTAAYMAPEQAKGKPVDKRADIWAFGVVLYEMLTGRSLFVSETIPETLAHVMTREPDMGVLPADTPRRLRDLIARCLVKDPKQRLRDIGDARITLDKVVSGAPDEVASAAPAAPAARPAGRRVFWPVLAVVASSAAIALAVLPLFRTATAPPPVTFNITPPPGVTIGSLPVRVSPDGRKVAYGGLQGGRRQFFVHSLDTGADTALAGTEEFQPAVFTWSPASDAIAFSAQDGKLRRVPVQGGPTQVITTLPQDQILSGHWGPGDVILLSPASAGQQRVILRVSAAGGTPEPVTELDGSKDEVAHGWASFFPDGRHFFFLAADKSRGARAGYIGSLGSKTDRRPLPGIASRVEYAPTGHLLFLREGALMSQPFDLDRLELGDTAVLVADVIAGTTALNGPFSVSANGVLLYRAGGSRISQLVWFDRQGRQLAKAGTPGDYGDIELSPDDRHVAYEAGTPGDVWVLDLQNGVPQRVTSNPVREADPVWSPDGRTIAFRSERDGGRMFTRPFGVVGEDTPLLKSETRDSPISWSKDGFVAYESQNGMFALPLAGDRKPIRVTPPQGTTQQQAGQISPDGKWIAYQSNELGSVNEIFIQSFPMPGAKQRASSGGGMMPRWSRDGKEVFYVSTTRFLMAVAVKTSGDSLSVGTATELFQVPLSGGGEQEYAVASDGRFLINVPGAEVADPPIRVILNWSGTPSSYLRR
jgi:Tol biopolymer transport system component